jgi:hypothetical protein
VIILVYINNIHIDNFSALAAGLVVLMLFIFVVFLVVVAGMGAYLAFTTWLKTRHMKEE